MNTTKPFHRPAPRAGLAGLWAVTIACLATSGSAAPPNQWEVLRVFIRDDTEQVNKLVTGHYKNVKLADLERDLAEHNNLRKVLPLKTAALEDAVYVARLEGESIISDQSRWKLSGTESAQAVELGNVSLALRTARYIAPSSLQLTDFALYSPNGLIELPLATAEHGYWFGFSVHSDEQEHGRAFNIRIPPAITAKLLLAAPANVDLSSPSLVVEKIASLAGQLPTDWSSTMPPVGSGSQWWLVHLAGVSQFELTVISNGDSDLTRFKHLAYTATVEYIASPGQLEARASFSVVSPRSATTLRIQASSDLRIETVLVNGQPTSWHVLPGSTDKINLIDLPQLDKRSDAVEIELRALCPLDTRRTVELPHIALAETYAMDGKTRLFSRSGLVTDSLATQSVPAEEVIAKRVPRVPFDSTSDELSQSALASNLPRVESRDESPVELPQESRDESRDESRVWQASWLGSPPQFVALFSQQRQPKSANSLTRFSIQDEWLAANCRMRIEASQIQSNEIRLPVGKGWFIDSVRLIGAEPNVRVRVEDRVNAASPILVIHWEGYRRQLAFDLEVQAHSPQEMSSGIVSLNSPRLITLPQADQIDHYTIEPSSRFSVQISPKLLPYQRQISDLPTWQQQLLPVQANLWIFQGVRGSIPAITLTAASGSFSSSILTVLQPLHAKTNVITRIECKPTSGTIDRLRLTLPPGAPTSDWKWSLYPVGRVDERVVLHALPVEVASNSSNEELSPTIELEFPTPQATPFVLTNEILLDNTGPTGELKIPMVGIPAAVGNESILLLPPELAQSSSYAAAEILPVSSTASEIAGSVLSAELHGAFASYRDQPRVAIRMQGGVSQWLSLKPAAFPTPQGWVWSEAIRHTLSENGRVEHEVQWTLEATQHEPITVRIPVGWWVDQVWLDDVLTSDSLPDGQLLRLHLPRSGRTTVKLRCASHYERPGWLCYVPIQHPSLSLPILASRTTTAIPPSRMAVRSLLSRWGAPPAQSRLVDRLLPKVWWRLLAPFQSIQSFPVGNSSLDGPPLPEGWSVVESTANSSIPLAAQGIPPKPATSPGNTPGEWIISRSAFSAMTMAIVMTLATIFWSSLKTSLWRWWVAATLTILGSVLVPAVLLAPAQLILLALVLAALLRLCMIVFSVRGSGSLTKPRGRSSVVHSPPLISSTSAVVLVCLGNMVCGQTVPTSNATLPSITQRLENPTPEDATAERPEIFSVLIPIDESGEAAGDYAYAPRQLLDLLEKGGDVASRELPPKIRTADYTLRMRRGQVGSPDQVQELFVELRLQVSQADIEIRLPFESSQLQLQSGSVGEQEIYIGGRSLYQLPDAVVFRPSATGSLRLQLHFEPLDIDFSETQAELRCRIPTVPTATMRIIADSSSNFQVLSTGTGRKTITTEYTELLGPVAELNVRWSPSSQRNMVGQSAAEVFADTWLYARGGRVSAICQLRIENARSLPRDLHVVTEPGWEPVGLSWEYGELLTSEVSAMGGRRVYTVRGNDGWDQLARRVLRILMVPRSDADLSSQSVPFLSLRDVSPSTVTRTLAWSAEEGATWRPDGLDLWQELKYMPGLEWGKFSWKVRPQLFRVIGTLATSLRTSSPKPLASINEMTQVHLAQGETKLNYRGQLTAPPAQAMTLLIPRQARVDSLTVDGSAINYRRAERDELATIEVLSDDRSPRGRVVELALSLPLKMGTPTPAPRVFMRGSQATQSIYRVLCGAGLECHLSGSDELKLAPIPILPRELLPALETLVGQVDLGNNYRELTTLPLQVDVRRRPEIPLAGAVMALEQSEQGWQATLTAQWKTGDQPLDFVFFELPVSVFDSIDAGPLPVQFNTLGDSGRMTMSLIAPPPVSGLTEVEFGFTLPVSTSSQTFAIPDIFVLSESPVRPLLALPQNVGGQAVEWSQPGRSLDNPPSVSVGKSWQEGYQFFEVEPAQTQVSWKRFEATERNAQLLVSHLILLDHQVGRIAGVANYWLSPHGQKELSLTLPTQCQVLGVEIGSSPAVWSLEQRQLKVLLQPNFVPLNVRVLLQWETNEPNSVALAFPQVVDVEINNETLQFVENQLPSLHAEAVPGSEAQPAMPPDISQRWLQLVTETFQAIRKRSPHETRAWLKLWNPSLVGIDGRVVIQLDPTAISALDPNAEAAETPIVSTTNDVWQRLWQLTEVEGVANQGETSKLADDPSAMSAPADSAPSPSLVQTPKQFVRLAQQQDVLTLSQITSSPNWTAQWLASGMLAAAAILILFLAQRLGGSYLKLISSQPWVYWLQLAAIAWCLLPLSWPSWVLGATAVGLLASQLIQARRRQRSLARM